MSFLKEIWNDNSIGATSTEDKSINCQSVSQIYIQALKDSNNFDPEAVFLTVKVGEVVAVSRVSLETLGNYWNVKEGGQVLAGGDQTGLTYFAVDMGQWLLNPNERLTVQIENTDAEAVTFTIVANINGVGGSRPTVYGVHTAESFNVQGLKGLMCFDFDGNLTSSTGYYIVSGHQITVESAITAHHCEAISDVSANTSSAMVYETEIPVDTDVFQSSSALSALVISAYENPELDKKDSTVGTSIAKASLGKRSTANITSAQR
jgi:hypothetical protein